jgi:hypothetical protein
LRTTRLYIAKGVVRDDNKKAKVEFVVAPIWYSNPGKSEPQASRKEEENLTAVCPADCASYLDSLLHATTPVPLYTTTI